MHSVLYGYSRLCPSRPSVYEDLLRMPHRSRGMNIAFGSFPPYRCDGIPFLRRSFGMNSSERIRPGKGLLPMNCVRVSSCIPCICCPNRSCVFQAILLRRIRCFRIRASVLTNHICMMSSCAYVRRFRCVHIRRYGRCYCKNYALRRAFVSYLQRWCNRRFDILYNDKSCPKLSISDSSDSCVRGRMPRRLP